MGDINTDPVVLWSFQFNGEGYPSEPIPKDVLAKARSFGPLRFDKRTKGYRVISSWAEERQHELNKEWLFRHPERHKRHFKNRVNEP